MGFNKWGVMVNLDRVILLLDSDLNSRRIKRPGDSTDDGVRRASARNESVPNLGIPLIGAPGSPLTVQDEYVNSDSSRSTLAELSADAPH